MTLFLHNTLTRKKEEFAPIDANHVRMYVCGPTVYNRIHVGNARPVAVFDVLYRLLKTLYPKVTYVRNITDVDDKIIKASLESGKSPQEITTLYAEKYLEDTRALNALDVDHTPKATEHIGEMITMIETLIEKGHAYEAEGHVLFHVSSCDKYGQLSNRSQDEMIAGARVEIAPYKKDPADFVLWKPAKEEEPGWESPWGRGRPGWHIECSAMSEKYLGESFDIHGGGLDLIFPHHENEMAQSSCAHAGKVQAKYWVHNGFVTDRGEKMSKSLGNFFMMDKALEEVPGEAVRLALLGAHYRQPLDWSVEVLHQAKSTLDKFYTCLRKHQDLLDTPAQVCEQVNAALLDDLNTPLAISKMHEMVTALNKAESAEKANLMARLKGSAQILGILAQDPETWFHQKELRLEAAEIESLINLRNEARKNKDFAKADEIRQQLLGEGIVLEDTADGTLWKQE